MATDQVTARRHDWTHERADQHVRSYVWVRTDEDEAYVRGVVDRLVTEGCCVWHACHLERVARIEDGRVATDLCSLCGGRNLAGEGDHNLCVARARRGRTEFERLDILDSLICGCAICENEREAERTAVAR